MTTTAVEDSGLLNEKVALDGQEDDREVSDPFFVKFDEGQNAAFGIALLGLRYSRRKFFPKLGNSIRVRRHTSSQEVS